MKTKGNHTYSLWEGGKNSGTYTALNFSCQWDTLIFIIGRMGCEKAITQTACGKGAKFRSLHGPEFQLSVRQPNQSHLTHPPIRIKKYYANNMAHLPSIKAHDKSLGWADFLYETLKKHSFTKMAVSPLIMVQFEKFENGHTLDFKPNLSDVTMTSRATRRAR